MKSISQNKKLWARSSISCPTRSRSRLSRGERCSLTESADEDPVCCLGPVIADTLWHPGSLSSPGDSGLFNPSLQSPLGKMVMKTNKVVVTDSDVLPANSSPSPYSAPLEWHQRLIWRQSPPDLADRLDIWESHWSPSHTCSLVYRPH